MKTKFYSRITFKIFMALMIGFIAAYEVMGISSSYLLPFLFPNETESLLYLLVGGGLMFLLPFLTFIFTIVVLIRKRLKYFKYIMLSLEKISQNEFLSPVEIRGGDEFAVLAESINTMSDRIKAKYENEKQIEELKNELIANMAHDLKSPLTSIIGYMDLIIEKKYESEDNRKRYEEIVYSKSKYLDYLVNSLFQYTLLMDGNVYLKRERLDISLILLQSLGESFSYFEDRDIEIFMDNIKSGVYLDIDGSQFMRVFENLISNAVKYGKINSIFKVSLLEENETIYMNFENETEGLDSCDIKKIFEKSFRADKARNSEKSGSGLGLAICKRIIELHNGEISATYKDKKIIFTIKLRK